MQITTRCLLPVALLLWPLATPAQDCSQVPEPYRAQCEANHTPQGTPLDSAGMGAQMQGAMDALQVCAGKSGDALKTCVIQNSSSGMGEAQCSSLPADRQARCEAMKSVATQARESCKARFDASNRQAFEACVRDEIAQHRPQR